MTVRPPASPRFAPPLVALLAPLLFIHVTYQPTWSVGIGSTSVTTSLSDLAALAIAGVGLAAGLRAGFAPLRRGRTVLLASATFVAAIFLATAHPLLWQDEYRGLVHLVSAAKVAEYALLVAAVPLALRRRQDAWLLYTSLTVWSVLATAGAVLQFFGLVNELEGRRPGQREPSFLGIHDFAALSGAAVALAIAAIAFGPLTNRRERVVAVAAGVSGTLGLALSGAAAGVVGTAVAAGAALALARLLRTLTLARVVTVAAIVGAFGLGALAIRSLDFDPLLKAVGVEPARTSERVESASYSQRSLLAYIGTRVFLAHPLTGVGWHGTSEFENYGPYLDDARRRYPDEPALSFPSRTHPWGVQNAYIQVAAELGIGGLALFLLLFAAGIGVAARAALRASRPVHAEAVPILWLLVTMGVWIGLGLVAGIPVAALQWLALGLAAATPTWARA